MQPREGEIFTPARARFTTSGGINTDVGGRAEVIRQPGKYLMIGVARIGARNRYGMSDRRLVYTVRDVCMRV